MKTLHRTQNTLPLLSLFAIAAIVSVGCNASRPSDSAPKSAPSPTPVVRLKASVNLTAKGVSIVNTGDDEIPPMRIKLNMTQLGSTDGIAQAPRLAKGKTLLVPYAEFTVGSTRFDPNRTKINTVYINASDQGRSLFICPGTVCSQDHN